MYINKKGKSFESVQRDTNNEYKKYFSHEITKIKGSLHSKN